MTSSTHHIPVRTCIACRRTASKKDLIRLVRSTVGTIEIDDKNRMPGRGAYLCRRKECWDQALAMGRKDRIAHAFRTTVSPVNRVTLSEYSNEFLSPEVVAAKEVG